VPDAAFEALERDITAEMDTLLFTVLSWDGERRSLVRLFSTREDINPTGVRKDEGVGGLWAGQVLDAGQCFLTAEPAGIRAAYGDWQVLLDNGCASAMNVPIIAMGRVVGTINVLGPGRLQRPHPCCPARNRRRPHTAAANGVAAAGTEGDRR